MFSHFLILIVLNLSSPLLAQTQTRFLPGSFMGFDAQDDFETNRSRRHDSETESDFLTYRPLSCVNKYILNASANSLCSSLGSLGSKRFLVDHFFMFNHRLNENFFFRAQWVKDQDYGNNAKAESAEFIYTPSVYHAFGVHGQFDSRKSADDFGLSYNYSSSNLFARLEFTAFDFSRNERNEEADRFEQNPYTFSFSVAHIESPDQIVFLRTQIEPQWIWDRPDVGLNLKRSQSDSEALIHWGRHTSTAQYKMQRLQINNDFEEERLLRLHWQSEWASLPLQTGLRWVHKNWSSPAGEIAQTSALPFAWYRFENAPSFRFGYELTWYNSYGEDLLKSHPSSAIEHRGNLGWTALQTNDAKLEFLFTMDLDRFGSNETWEGGNGQFSLNF